MWIKKDFDKLKKEQCEINIQIRKKIIEDIFNYLETEIN